MKTKIIGVLLILLISFVFLTIGCSSTPLPTIKSNEAADYLWERVQMEITPIEQLNDEYRTRHFYLTRGSAHYHVYKTSEEILVLVENPNKLSLEKTVKVTGRIEQYYTTKPGNYELVIYLMDFH